MLGMKAGRAYVFDYREKNACIKMGSKLRKLLPSKREITFLCIGTDRVLADVFGPLVGSLLVDMGIKNVLGVLGQPVHAKNLTVSVAGIPKKNFVVAVDAMSGMEENLGKIRLRRGNCYPGTGLKKRLLPVGDVTVSFNVAVERGTGLDLNVSPEMIWCGATLTVGMIVNAMQEIEISQSDKFSLKMFSRDYRQILFS